MPLFACRKCNCVENTALCNYWMCAGEGKPPLCSACDPAIAEWHGRFKKKSASGYLQGADGFLYDPAWNNINPRTKMIGIVP